MFPALVAAFAFGFGLIYGSPVIVFASVWLAYFVALAGVDCNE
jgi:hypothetical protein